MKKSCNRCRAFCRAIFINSGDQGCGLGFKTKLIRGVASSSCMCHVVVIAPDEECTPVANLKDAIKLGVCESKVVKWWGYFDWEKKYKDPNHGPKTTS